MAAASFLNSLYLRYLAKPVTDRPLFSLIARNKITRMVELGVGNGVRSRRMIEIAQRHSEGEIHYAGIDMFEGRDDAQSGLSLKTAYQTLRATGAKVQLIPGDPFAALARTANTLTGTQLLIIAADQDETSLGRAWFYIPRMLTEASVVFVQDAATGKFNRLTRAELETLAGQQSQRRRAA